MSEHDKLAAYRLEALIANEYQSAFNQRVLDIVAAALAAARAEGAAEAFEKAAKVCDERAGRWRLRAERCARSGDKMSLVHSDRMDEAESCAIDIRDRALAEKEAAE